MALARAFVEILADTSNFDRDLGNKLKEAGRNAGDKFCEGFQRSIKDCGNKAADSLGDGLKKSVGKAARGAGKEFCKAFQETMKDCGDKAGDVLAKSVDKRIGDKAKTQGRRFSRSFAAGVREGGKDVENAVKDSTGGATSSTNSRAEQSGRRSGQSWASGFGGSIRNSLVGLAAGTLGAIGPSLGAPLLAGLATSVGGLAAAAGGVAAFSAVAIPAIKDVVSEEKALFDLSPEQQQARRNWQGLTDQFRQLQQAYTPTVMNAFNAALGTTSTLMQSAGPFIKSTGDNLTDVFNGLNETLKQPYWQETLGYLGKRSGPVLKNLANAAGNAVGGVTALGTAFDRAIGQNMFQGLEDGAASFNKWAQGVEQTQGFKDFVGFVQQEWPKVSNILGNVGEIGVSIAQGLAPISSVATSMLSGITSVISGVLGSGIGQIGIAAVGAGIGLRKVGDAVGWVADKARDFRSRSVGEMVFGRERFGKISGSASKFSETAETICNSVDAATDCLDALDSAGGKKNKVADTLDDLGDTTRKSEGKIKSGMRGIGSALGTIGGVAAGLVGVSAPVLAIGAAVGAAAYGGYKLWEKYKISDEPSEAVEQYRAQLKDLEDNYKKIQKPGQSFEDVISQFPKGMERRAELQKKIAEQEEAARREAAQKVVDDQKKVLANQQQFNQEYGQILAQTPRIFNSATGGLTQGLAAGVKDIAGVGTVWAANAQELGQTMARGWQAVNSMVTDASYQLKSGGTSRTIGENELGVFQQAVGVINQGLGNISTEAVQAFNSHLGIKSPMMDAAAKTLGDYWNNLPMEMRAAAASVPGMAQAMKESFQDSGVGPEGVAEALKTPLEKATDEVAKNTAQMSKTLCDVIAGDVTGAAQGCLDAATKKPLKPGEQPPMKPTDFVPKGFENLSEQVKEMCVANQQAMTCALTPMEMPSQQVIPGSKMPLPLEQQKQLSQRDVCGATAQNFVCAMTREVKINDVLAKQGAGKLGSNTDMCGQYAQTFVCAMTRNVQITDQIAQQGGGTKNAMSNMCDQYARVFQCAVTRQVDITDKTSGAVTGTSTLCDTFKNSMQGCTVTPPKVNTGTTGATTPQATPSAACPPGGVQCDAQLNWNAVSSPCGTMIGCTASLSWAPIASPCGSMIGCTAQLNWAPIASPCGQVIGCTAKLSWGVVNSPCPSVIGCTAKVNWAPAKLTCPTPCTVKVGWNPEKLKCPEPCRVRVSWAPEKFSCPSSCTVAVNYTGTPPKCTADGGIFSRAETRVIGEAGPEAVIPMSGAKRHRALALLRQSGLDNLVRETESSSSASTGVPGSSRVGVAQQNITVYQYNQPTITTASSDPDIVAAKVVGVMVTEASDWGGF